MTHDRQPEITRRRILETAAEEIHRHGFQAASVSEILDRTGLSKGAFYHHFPTKHELGYAVLEELFAEWHREMWDPVLEAPDALEALIDFLSGAPETVEREGLECGCPLNNLNMEMSPLDEGFRTRIESLFDSWRRGIAGALRQGQAHGKVLASVDADQVATFILASLEGSIGLAKNSQSYEVFEEALGGLKLFLDSLRPAPAAATA